MSCVSTIPLRCCRCSSLGQFPLSSSESATSRGSISSFSQLSSGTGKFALSSTPGCGKTFATNFIFKMASSNPFLQNRPILYQFGAEFCLLQSDKVFDIDRETALRSARLHATFYVLDGLDAEPVPSDCLTLFISSPRNNKFKDWHNQAQITPSYFPVWSLDELRQCRALCYKNIDQATVDIRYKQYGGVARYVFWIDGIPPSLEGAISDNDARKSIRSVGAPSQLSHMLLHIAVDECMHFKNVVLASRHVGVLLFSKYFEETLDTLKLLLGGGGALGGHLFECYGHFLFEYGRKQPLICQSLEGDDSQFILHLQSRKVNTFGEEPKSLLNDTYYIPLSTNFAAVDALTKEASLQYTVTMDHPVKGPQVLNRLAPLYPNNELVLVFVAPELIAGEFKKQPIVAVAGQAPKNLPRVRQYVAMLSLGIDTSLTRKFPVTS